MLQIDPTRVKEDIEDRLRTEEDSVNWLRDKMKQSMELTSTMTGESKFFDILDLEFKVALSFQMFSLHLKKG